MAAAHLTWTTVTLRLAAATFFGFAVGFEREVDGHDAGTRTHALLALGAAVFGVISVGAFHGFLATGAPHAVSYDPSRVASYVAAGIGFLGAGAILKTEHRVYGLTTAASLWVVAAVGLASGLGFWPAAVVGGVLAIVVLLADRPMRRTMTRLRRGRSPLDGG